MPESQLARDLAWVHPAWMVASLALAFVTLRAGLAMRSARRSGGRRDPARRRSHARLGKIAVVAILAGFVAGPASMVWFRGEEPFGTVHALLGAAAASLFASAGWLGRGLERGRGGGPDAHAVLGLLAMLAGAVAAVAGFVLLP